MRFSISAPESLRRGRRSEGWIAVSLGSLVLIAALIHGARAGAAEWTITPRLSLLGGDESDLILDPNVDGAVVDAGAFVDLRPELSAVTRLGDSSRLRLSTQGVLERYLDAGGRLIYAQSLGGEFVHYGSHALRTRLFVTGDTFHDSQRSTVQRWGGYAGGALGLARPGFSLEATGALAAKRYPQLTLPDAAGVPGDYSESSWVLGANAIVGTGRFLARPEVAYQSTSARDPLFESTSVVFGLRTSLGIGARAQLVTSLMSQTRTFPQRAFNADRDELLQAGVGVDFTMMADTQFLARWNFVRYTRTTGEDQDTHRIEVGFRRSFGGSASPLDLASTLGRLQGVGSDLAEGSDSGRVRFYAPGAQRVQLVGDFNGWSTTRDALVASGDGWWEIRVELPPGVYQYKLLVDDEWVVPELSMRTVPDGFGGVNAVLEILPPIL